MLVSDCCGARALGNGDCDSEDMGICPNCLEHCSYIDEDDEDIDDEEDIDDDVTD